eukprot:GHVQ01023526.1.p1 GENE.GHVQ01023526.1~~GHVQ01023526.1.p1  ORF type:complete len:428 (+),score=91.39 GHVQ01023526.1:330-1613(+)
MREDPTFKVHQDEESGQMLMYGMGELQLELIVERLKRECGVTLETGPPAVNYRETTTYPAKFDYTYEKCSVNHLDLSDHPMALAHVETQRTGTSSVPYGPGECLIGDKEEEGGRDGGRKVSLSVGEIGGQIGDGLGGLRGSNLKKEGSNVDKSLPQQSEFVVGNAVNVKGKKKRICASIQGFVESTVDDNKYNNCSQDYDDDEDEYKESISRNSNTNHKQQETVEVTQNISEGSELGDKLFQAVEQGIKMSLQKSPVTGFKVVNVRFVITGYHKVEGCATPEAFLAAAKGVVNCFYEQACPVVLEPVMRVHISSPAEFQSAVLHTITRRNGQPHQIENKGDSVTYEVMMPLKKMFGYISELRASSEGQGDYSMEFESYEPVSSSEQSEMQAAYIQVEEEKKGGGAKRMKQDDKHIVPEGVTVSVMTG